MAYVDSNQHFWSIFHKLLFVFICLPTTEETSLHYVPLNWNGLQLFSYHQRTVVMSEANDDISRFKKWLEANGAKFPKVEWPSLDTTGGVRGATAIDNIATNEVMIEIPNHIMMSPPVAFASDIGSLLRQNSDILRTDLLLSVFIMSERSKGERSFFYPFLRILPVPGTVANWDDKDLLHLQVGWKTFSQSSSQSLTPCLFCYSLRMMHYTFVRKEDWFL